MDPHSQLDLDIVFDNGFIFLKLIECLKNSDSSMIEFTQTSIKYNELVNKQPNTKKKYLSTNNSFELYPSKLSKYYYGFDEPKYLMYFDVKELKDKIKDCKNKDKIRIYKIKGEDLIYTITSKPDGSTMGVSFFKPFNMQNQEFVIYAKSLRDDDNPNCTVKPAILKENCTKVRPAAYKKVILVCYHSHMIAKIIGPDNSNGHVFPYGSIPAPITPINIDINKININLGNLKINSNLNTVVSSKPSKVNIDNGTSFEINISTQTFKSLGKLVPLSSEPIKIFFEEGTYIKILTNIGDFGHIRTYIGNDFNV